MSWYFNLNTKQKQQIFSLLPRFHQTHKKSQERWIKLVTHSIKRIKLQCSKVTFKMFPTYPEGSQNDSSDLLLDRLLQDVRERRHHVVAPQLLTELRAEGQQPNAEDHLVLQLKATLVAQDRRDAKTDTYTQQNKTNRKNEWERKKPQRGNQQRLWGLFFPIHYFFPLHYLYWWLLLKCPARLIRWRKGTNDFSETSCDWNWSNKLPSAEMLSTQITTVSSNLKWEAGFRLLHLYYESQNWNVQGVCGQGKNWSNF